MYFCGDGPPNSPPIDFLRRYMIRKTAIRAPERKSVTEKAKLWKREYLKLLLFLRFDIESKIIDSCN